jgi:hypothetical protein
VDPLVLYSTANSLPLLAVVLLNTPNDNETPVYVDASNPEIIKSLPTVLVKNTLPLPEAPAYPDDAEVLLTSPEPVKVNTPLFCQPVYEVIAVVEAGLPTFSEKIVAEKIFFPNTHKERSNRK